MKPTASNAVIPSKVAPKVARASPVKGEPANSKKEVENCVNNYENCGIIQNLDIITANAEAILDEVAELKAYICKSKRTEATKTNICSIKNFNEAKSEKNEKNCN